MQQPLLIQMTGMMLHYGNACVAEQWLLVGCMDGRTEFGS
jgi:hypothetical protein